MTLKRNTLKFLIVFWTNVLAVSLAAAVVDIRTAADGTIDFKANDAPLDEIFKTIEVNFKIEVKGLKAQAGKKITFSKKAETTEDLLKSLLRHLGIKNYALEFADAKLRRLVVVPEAGDIQTASPSPKDRKEQQEFVSVAKIQSIVADSQAETVGLQEGDFILEYDSVQIRSGQQLVQEVEKKTASTQVEMLIVRQKIPSRVILSGGFIGVRVTTEKIPRNEFDAYQSVN